MVHLKVVHTVVEYVESFFLKQIRPEEEGSLGSDSTHIYYAAFAAGVLSI